MNNTHHQRFPNCPVRAKPYIYVAAALLCLPVQGVLLAKDRLDAPDTETPEAISEVIWHLCQKPTPLEFPPSIAACTNLLRFGAPPDACDSIRDSFKASGGTTIRAAQLGMFHFSSSGHISFYAHHYSRGAGLYFFDGIPLDTHSTGVNIEKLAHHEYRITFLK